MYSIWKYRIADEVRWVKRKFLILDTNAENIECTLCHERSLHCLNWKMHAHTGCSCFAFHKARRVTSESTSATSISDFQLTPPFSKKSSADLWKQEYVNTDAAKPTSDNKTVSCLQAWRCWTYETAMWCREIHLLPHQPTTFYLLQHNKGCQIEGCTMDIIYNQRLNLICHLCLLDELWQRQ